MKAAIFPRDAISSSTLTIYHTVDQVLVNVNEEREIHSLCLLVKVLHNWLTWLGVRD